MSGDSLRACLGLLMHMTPDTSPIRFLTRDDFADVPLKINWEEANTVLASIWSMSRLQRAELDAHQTMKFLDLVKNTLIDKHRTLMALESVGSIDDLRRVVARNGAAAATMEIRTQEWFDEHGRFNSANLVRCYLHFTYLFCYCRSLS